MTKQNGFRNSHNPYFNRWFSAIKEDKIIKSYNLCHNPYFNRWFSAILANKVTRYEY